MKVAAIGDAHLGRTYLNVVDQTGVNQREVDFEQSFTAAVDLALAQEPNLIVWLGDIFDHPRPTYRSYAVAQRGLATIRQHGIPLVAITGNHDTPRMPGTGSPYTTLADAFEGFRFARRMAYEHVDLPGVRVHCVPQTLTVEAALEALDEADANRSLDRSNLLLTHPRLVQVQPSHADINEIELDAGALRSDFVLLGHYHAYQRVQQGIWYAGSTDTFTFADDPGSAKGVVVLDTDTGTCTHVPLADQRPVIDLDPIYAPGLSPTEVTACLVAAAADAPDGAVARVILEGVEPEAWRLHDALAVAEAARHLLHLSVRPELAGAIGEVDLRGISYESIPAEWDRYFDAQKTLEGFDRDRLRDLGHDYLRRAADQAAS